MAKYFPEPAPFALTDREQEFMDYIARELNRVSQTLLDQADITIDEKFVAPEKPQIGQIAFADGTRWNPGDGEGFYGYNGSVWTKFDNNAPGGPFQASDSTLTALAAYNTNGLLTQTAADTFAGRTITGTANKIDVTNGSGVAGNPALTIPDAVTLVTPTISGLLTANAGATIGGGVIQLDSTGGSIKIGGLINQNNGLELGYTGGVNTISFIDFHTSATAVDYDFRIRVDGNTGTVGGGTLTLNGATVAFSTANLTGSGNWNTTGNLQKNGTTIPFQAAFESSQQTITAGGALTLAHGLGVKPKLYLGFLQCVTAEGGYSIGDEIAIGNVEYDTGSNGRYAMLRPDATNINVRFGNNSTVFDIWNNTTGAHLAATNANWKLVVRAWA